MHAKSFAQGSDVRPLRIVNYPDYAQFRKHESYLFRIHMVICTDSAARAGSPWRLGVRRHPVGCRDVQSSKGKGQTLWERLSSGLR